ncbi:MAG: IS30 family transposase, partial [Lachnospiraceae bacterium]|nr:IS30 family transposase [Lachnospiraceae bacterium]
LTREDRIQIELLLKLEYSVSKISKMLGVHYSTIYREIRRGRFEALKSDLTTEERYSPDIADKKYRENLAAKGPNLKIGKDLKFASYIEDKILNEHYSPEAVLGELKAQNRESEFSITLCKNTIYSYIDKGIFLQLTNKDLPVKKNKKRKYNKIKRLHKPPVGTSIEKRPEEILTRDEFGHWEMDTVIGKRGKSKHSLLVLTERKTRKEIIHLLEEHTARAVVDKLDLMERRMGDMFYKIFKSITVDNGTEFSYFSEMERSALNDKLRTKLFYCHPYSSYERGTNENTNKMIRRHIPKSTNFDDKTDEDIQFIEDWINNYPRRMHGFCSANDLYNQEINKILQAG